MSLHFHPLRLRAKHQDTDDAVVLCFEVPEALRDTFRFTQGQYLTLRGDVDGQDLRRSYSICAGIDDGELRVGVRQVDGGAFSTWVTRSRSSRRKAASTCRWTRARRGITSASRRVRASRPSCRS